MKIFLKIMTVAISVITLHTSQAQKPSSPMSWTLLCRGLTSGKEITFSGTPDELNHFRKIFKEKTVGMENEKLVMEMTFLNTTVLLKDTLNYKRASHFVQDHSLLLSKCEIYDYSGANFNSLWLEPFFRTNNIIVSNIDKELPAEGKGSFYMEGISTNSTNQNYVCALTRNIQTGELAVHSDPADTWFFLYLKGDLDSNAYFNLLVLQQDEGTTTKNYYSKDISLNFNGWKQIAIRFSDMHSVSSIDQKRNTKYIRSISYGLYTNNPTAKVKMHMDYLSILFARPKKL